MRQSEFSQLFPNADTPKFTRDYDGTMVFIDDDGVLVDVESMAFLDDFNKVKHLNLPPQGLQWWRNSHEGFLEEWRRRYKYRNLDHDDLFPLSYKPPLYPSWGPQEWDMNKTGKTPHVITLISPKDINLEKFRVYVNKTDFFMMEERFPWDLSNVQKIDFNDLKNEYCLSLKAMYVLSYLGGIGLKNLKSDNPISKSLAHFYFYYHLQKFYNYRNMKRYDTTLVENFNWSLYSWKRHHVWYHPGVHYTANELRYNKSDIIEHIYHEGNKVYYDVRLGKRDVSKDYLRLLNKDGKGLTSIGQLLLQESCQAYVYCILGAQAKTRWKIVGDSANSLQTQRVFQDLVAEVTKQDNLSVLIKSMRTAIVDTRVRLNFCISPGLELLPGNMVFIKDTPGYNNILIVSTSKQKFGVNTSVNTSLKQIETPVRTPVTKVQRFVNTSAREPQDKVQRLVGYHDGDATTPTNTQNNVGIILIRILLASPLLWILL